MGMSDTQFKAYVRKVKKLLDKANEATDPAEKAILLQELAEELQQDLEA